MTWGHCQMFGDGESDTESIPSEKGHKKTAVARHASREAFKKGVVRPISLSLSPDTRGCAPSLPFLFYLATSRSHACLVPRPQ